MTMTLDQVRSLADAIRAEIAKAIVGQEHMVDMLLTALLSEGHVLLEGPPGTAKTLLANAFATALGLDFGRIQFTPDLMPGDILGSNLFNFQTSQFTLTRGPIFCDLLLGDEINRTPPKTQAALLEAMQERRVTLDGETHQLPERFMVVATQNPIENQGVYPLPEAQLDRFLFKLLVPYPDEAEEARIVATYGQRSGPQRPAAGSCRTPPRRGVVGRRRRRRGRRAAADASAASAAAPHYDPVGLPESEFRIAKQPREGTVVRQKNQSLRFLVEPADRLHRPRAEFSAAAVVTDVRTRGGG